MKRLRDDKKTFAAVVIICAVFVLLSCGIIVAIILGGKEKKPEKEPEKVYSDLFTEEIRGVWIATVSNINFPSSPDLSETELKAELDSIVENVKAAGLNTIFFQVRPSCDALYKSEIYPVSRYLSSDGTLTLDTLQYIIAAAHGQNIKVHAWINPLRVSPGSSFDALPAMSPAKNSPERCVCYADGKLYYNCGLPEVREEIAAGIREIVENYDVDGIVFDDYFYPYPVTDGDGQTADFDDGAAFKEYGGGFESVADWRRDNVNRLVKEAYEAVKSADEGCMFGVSPFGIWKNGYGGEEGSATAGMQSYYDIYCDTLAWVSGGYVDYIAPQLYWRVTESAAPYDALCDWWAQRLDGSDVKLLISHGAYRYAEWETPEGEITSQVKYAGGKKSYAGSIFYGYEQIKADTCGIRGELLKLYGGG